MGRRGVWPSSPSPPGISSAGEGAGLGVGVRPLQHLRIGRHRAQHRDAGRQSVFHSGYRPWIQRRHPPRRQRLQLGGGRGYPQLRRRQLRNTSTVRACPQVERLSGGGEAIGWGLCGRVSHSFGKTLLTGGVQAGWVGGLFVKADPDRNRAARTSILPTKAGWSLPDGLAIRQELIERPLISAAAIYAGFRPGHPERASPPLPRRQRRDRGQRQPHAGKALRRGDRRRRRAVRQLGRATCSTTSSPTPSPTSPSARVPARFRWPGFVPAGGTLFERGERRARSTPWASKVRAHRQIWPHPGASRRLHLYPRAGGWRQRGAAAHRAETGRRPPPPPSPPSPPGEPIDRLTLIGDVRYESARFDDDQNTRKIDAGTGVNARAEWALNPALNVFRRGRQPVRRRHRDGAQRRQHRQLRRAAHHSPWG